MTVALKEFETFAGSNTPVVGATVNVRAASDTHPNVGAVVASTTSNASGMWEFTALADGTYDVDITYNSRVRHRKGNSKFSNSLSGSNFAVQAANTILAGPASGAAAIPTFRVVIGAWTDWTPGGITQTGAVTFTVNRCRYKIVDKLIVAMFDVTLTSAGTAGAAIVMTLPAALTAAAGLGSVGSFRYIDASVATYQGSLELVSTTTFQGQVHNTAAGGLGAGPSFATANTDRWLGTLTYEGA